jgi:hypothetical protein
MQTIVQLDDKLFQEAAHYARTDNPGDLLHLALREFIRHHRPPQPVAAKRRLGMDMGRFDIPDDFDAPDPEIEKAFYGA